MNITATLDYEALHHWPDAPNSRAYLRHPHRHLFGLAATVAVTNSDRAVEFHDLADVLHHAADTLSSEYHPGVLVRDFGSMSCEAIATGLAKSLDDFGYDVVAVETSEDREHTATWSAGADR